MIFCDFNRGIYPQPAKVFDYTVCSGVLEYVRDARTFLLRVAMLGQTLVLSYNPIMDQESKLDRLAKGWVNHFRQDVLEAMLDELGFAWTVVNRREPNEVLYSIVRRKI